MDGKIHPCAYFSRHLSPAERNYAMGDRELLALKMALEECGATSSRVLQFLS